MYVYVCVCMCVCVSCTWDDGQLIQIENHRKYLRADSKINQSYILKCDKIIVLNVIKYDKMFLNVIKLYL